MVRIGLPSLILLENRDSQPLSQRFLGPSPPGQRLGKFRCQGSMPRLGCLLGSRFVTGKLGKLPPGGSQFGQCCRSGAIRHWQRRLR